MRPRLIVIYLLIVLVPLEAQTLLTSPSPTGWNEIFSRSPKFSR
ncbi:MAG: hypothetical protein ACKVHO_04865 [Verrucomicrobiia bacterium]